MPDKYNLFIYGRDVEKDYYQELRELVLKERLEKRVFFKGPVPTPELKKIYPQFCLMINMAKETIDKTMLEAMLFGIYPITTPDNSRAIGLPIWPNDEDPKDIANFILKEEWEKYKKEYLQNIVKEKHSLPALISKILVYINAGK